MIFFFVGFIFGLFVAQESPNFPNIKDNIITACVFVKKMVVQDSMPSVNSGDKNDVDSKKDS
jgi:hypothetical protein